MINRSEGVRRITFIFSVVALIAWIILVFLSSRGFSMIIGAEWIIVLVGIPVSYFIPQLILRLIYWLKDGFAQDKNT